MVRESNSPVAACLTLLHSTLCIALADVWLGCSCSAMKTHFIKLYTYGSWANLKAHEVWRSVVIDPAKIWRPLHTMCLSIHWPCSVISPGLPLCGWVAIVPNHFHFVIIPPTIDCEIFRSEENTHLVFLQRLHPITVPCWNSLSSWDWPSLSQIDTHWNA